MGWNGRRRWLFVRLAGCVFAVLLSVFLILIFILLLFDQPTLDVVHPFLQRADMADSPFFQLFKSLGDRK